MRKLINVLVFIGKCITAIGSAFEPLVPAYDEMKAKNDALNAAYAAKQEALEAEELAKNEVKQEVTNVINKL